MFVDLFPVIWQTSKHFSAGLYVIILSVDRNKKVLNKAETAIVNNRRTVDSAVMKYNWFHSIKKKRILLVSLRIFL